VDAALAVALANTLFFAAAKADSTGKVLLYLLLTVAPFAVIAPLIGPLLDRIQSGRRIALAISSFGRALLALTMALKFDSWVIYPCALGMLVLSKSFGVLKAALTPRVLPEEITLVKTNSRLSVFGLIAGGVAGAVAAGFSWLANSPGALFFTAACAVVCGVLCLRIPAWVESTEGEVPVRKRDRDPKQRVLPQAVAATLWTNATIRIETGFLALFVAFVVKSMYQSSSVVAPADGSLPAPLHPHTGFMQLALLGAVGAAAGIGGFVGNALGARLTLRNPERVAVFSLGAIILSVVVAILLPGLVTAGLVAFVGSTGSSLAKVCLDSVIQRDLPEVTRASAFGRSESVLQLSWVFGGVIGLLVGGVWALPHDAVFVVGFAIVALLLLLCGAQCVAMSVGRSLLPALHLGSSKASGTVGAAGSARLAAPGGPDPALSSYGSPTGPPGSGSAVPNGAGQPRVRKRTPRKAGDAR
jgi:MFS family permease